jgi:UDP-glucuronate 4-epimerase
MDNKAFYKTLVTGTAGFIGFHLAKKLLEEGQEIIGLDNINDYYDVNLKYARLAETGIAQDEIVYNKIVRSHCYPGYQFIKLQLEDRDSIVRLFEEQKIDCVCHLAAQAGVRYSIDNPYVYIQSNIVGFLNILEGCRHFHIKHLIYASSSSVYGLNEKMPFSTKDIVDHPISVYGATKKANELLAHSYSYLYNLPTTGLRFFTVYGPWGRPDMVLFKFTKAILEDKPIDIYNQGNMARDFTYIDDIVEGITRVFYSPLKENPDWSGQNPDPSGSKAPFKIYNIGNSHPVKLMDFIDILQKALDKTAKFNFLPLQPGDVVATHADINDLRINFDYCPKTCIEEGVGQFVNWYVRFYVRQNEADT